MGPKRRPLRGGRKRRKRGRKLGKGMTHVDKELFEIAIRVLTERIERRDALIEKLKSLKVEYETKYEKEAIERNQTIDSLNREIEIKRNELILIEENLVRVENLRRAEREKRQMETETIKADFGKLVDELKRERESLSQNLADMEDFKLRKEEIEAHIVSLENKLAEKTQNYEDEIKKLEKLYIVDHERLKKEMSRRVEEAAESCRKFSKDQMKYTVKRAIKETVRMGVQLKAVKETITKLEEENKNLITSNDSLKHEMKSSKNCSNEMLNKFQSQVQELKHLLQFCKTHKDDEATLELRKKENAELEETLVKESKLLAYTEGRVSNLSSEVKSLVIQEMEDEAKMEEQTGLVNGLYAIIQECDKFMKHTIIEIPNEEIDQVEYLGRRQMILSQLLEMLEKAIEMGETDYAELLYSQRASSRPLVLDQWIVDEPPFQYQIGDLGLLPKYAQRVSTSTEAPEEGVSKIPPITRLRDIIPDLAPRCKTILSKMGMLSKFVDLTNTIRNFH